MSFSPTYVAEMRERPVERVSGDRFKMCDKDRAKLMTAKYKHRKELQKFYGPSWKKHLNLPEKSIGKSVHVSF